MKILAPIFLILFASPAYSANDHTIFTSLLHQHVVAGKVNYKELCNDPRLEQYIDWLKRTNPYADRSEKNRLAFWINTYNGYTLKAICSRYPIKSINDLHSGGLALGTVFKTTIWDKDFVIVNQKATTLNDVEHKIIRPVFKDARIHFALVCAAKSCPPLRSEAFAGDTLDTQLNDQARLFLSDVQQNRFDPKQKRAELSKIFDWYGSDFGKNRAEMLLYFSQFLPADLAEAIKKEPDKWEVQYNNYDWSLNE